MYHKVILLLLVIYGKKLDLMIYSGTKLLQDMLWFLEQNLLDKWEILTLNNHMLNQQNKLKIVLLITIMMVVSLEKNHQDKKMQLLLLDSMMVMQEIHSLHLMMS